MTKKDIEEKLKNVKYPGFEKSIIDFGFVKNIEINEKKVCNIVLEIASSVKEVEARLRLDISKALEGLEISSLKLDIIKPKEQKQKSNSTSGKNVAPQIKNFVMISSGKGGVGKSTLSTNLAIAMAMQGKKVGLLDADIYGPNIPRMFGINGQSPEVVGSKAKPISAYGVDVMSMGLLAEEGQAFIWRGAMVMKVIAQLFRDILWEELDVLFIDMPPGTGDAQLTLAQSVPVTLGINVTTPQNVSLDDSKRSLDMFKKLHIPIAGIVENMSGFVCPKCNEVSDIFGKDTSLSLAKEYDTKVLANIPLEAEITTSGDNGKPFVYFHPESKSAKKYLELSNNLWEEIQKINDNNEADNSSIQPTMNMPK